jgi:hypothetical protein
MAGEIAVRIEDLNAVVKISHGVVYLVSEFLPDADMILNCRGQVAQHGIVFGGKRHQIRGIGGHDPIHAPIQIIERYRHMLGGANIEPDAQSVQLAHHDVFQATSYQLLSAFKNFRPDKTGDIIHMRPVASGVNFQDLMLQGSYSKLHSKQYY